ncbi:MAG: hypothetical protein HYZ28_15610 [Myxococcales bacterium]|nr:hypothetical protein [Myxococcales bacterium]
MQASLSRNPFGEMDLETTPVVARARPSAAKLELVSGDPRMEARVVARGTLTLLAYVPDEGPFDAYVALKVDGNFVTVAFHKGLDREGIFQAIRAALPPGFEAATPEGSESEVLIVNVMRLAGSEVAPHVMFASTDPGQRVRRAGRNKLSIDGVATRGFAHPAWIHLSVDGRQIEIPLSGGEGPLETAGLIRRALPGGYTAIIELPLYHGEEVKLTVVRRRSRAKGSTCRPAGGPGPVRTPRPT